MLSKDRIYSIGQAINNVKVGIIGDFCVDIYWHADMTKSELSRETPHYPLPVTKERFYAGAGGNVAANIAALKPKQLFAVSLIGDDWRGMLLREALKKQGISDEYLLTENGRFTNAYCKPMRKGISATEYEDPRIDFASFAPISEKTEREVIARLEEIAYKCDVLCVADQFSYGIITPIVREKISCFAKAGLPVIADSRCNIGLFNDCVLKPNEVECWRAVYGNNDFTNARIDDFYKAAQALSAQKNTAVFCTLGANGSVIAQNGTLSTVPAVKNEGEIDICGAGDTSLSAFTCAVGAGECYEDAARFAGLASSVTVKKIGITGTASIDEIAAANC